MYFEFAILIVTEFISIQHLLMVLKVGDEGYIRRLPVFYEDKKETHGQETETNPVKRRKGTAKEQ